MVSSINSSARYPNNGKDYEEDMIRYGCYSSGKLFVTRNTEIQSCLPVCVWCVWNGPNSCVEGISSSNLPVFAKKNQGLKARTRKEQKIPKWSRLRWNDVKIWVQMCWNTITHYSCTILLLRRHSKSGDLLNQITYVC